MLLFFMYQEEARIESPVTPQIFNFTSKFPPGMRILATTGKKETEQEMNASPFFYSLGSVQERSSSFSSQEHWTQNTGL